MKQFSILGGKAHVVELPEGHQQAFEALKNGRELTINRKRKSANVDHITFDFDFAEQLFIGGFLACTSGNLDTGDRHYLFGLGWQIVGMLPGVTEEQAALIVPIHRQSIIGDVYKDFTTGKWDAFDGLESLESAILAEGYTFSNPLGKAKDFKKKYTGHDMFFADHMVKYYDAQSRVLCRERCLLLKRSL